MARKEIKSVFLIVLFIFLSGRAYGQQEPSLSIGLAESDKVEYKSESLTDPFQEPKMEEKKKKEEPPEPPKPFEIRPLPPLEIQGIIWGSTMPLAIINNKVLKIGDTVGEVKIKEIAKGKVTVLFGNQEYILSTVTPTGNLKGPDKISEGGRYER